ncbi:hypothetical protein ACMA1I_09910 [Pontibacter sp. 13R65]|uniref:hypothetical protein n=1 Tax=Pontibacter sp. 13R65 TaxID=3127458 RepID=UPI00301CD623
MKKQIVSTVARLLLGTIFTFAGLNGLVLVIGFEPVGPTSLHVPLMQQLVNTAIIFIPLKLAETTAGLLLLSNRLVPLALLLLTPIALGILTFHLVADRAQLLNGIVVVGLLAVLLVQNRKNIKNLFRRKAVQQAY